MTDDTGDESQIQTELPRADVIALVPKLAPVTTVKDDVHAYSVATLKKLLAQAEAGEIVSVVVVSWHRAAEPQIHMSTEDKILALGAIRTMEHCLVREWLDGTVVP